MTFAVHLGEIAGRGLHLYAITGTELNSISRQSGFRYFGPIYPARLPGGGRRGGIGWNE